MSAPHLPVINAAATGSFSPHNGTLSPRSTGLSFGSPSSTVSPTSFKAATEDHEGAEDFALEAWRKEHDRDLQQTAFQLAVHQGLVASPKFDAMRTLKGSMASLASQSSLRSNASRAPSLPPLQLRELQQGSMLTEDLVATSQAIFSPHDQVLYSVCRGNMNSVLALREGCAAQSARERLQHLHQVGAEERKQAQEFRVRGGGKRSVALSARSPAATEGPKELTSGLVVKFLKGELPSEPDNSSFVSTNGEGLFKSMHSKAQGAQAEEPQPRKTALSHLKSAVQGHIVERDAEDKRKNEEKERKQKVAVKEEVKVDRDREAYQKALSHYADPETCIMPLECLPRCLLELGLGGSTRHERSVIEKMLTIAYFAILREQFSFRKRERRGEMGMAEPKASSTQKKSNVRSLGGVTEEQPPSEERQWHDTLVNKGEWPVQDMTSGTSGIFGERKHGLRIFLGLGVMASENEEAEPEERLPPFVTVIEAFKAAAEIVEVIQKPNAASENKFKRPAEEELALTLRRIPVSLDDLVSEIIPMVRSQLDELRKAKYLSAFQRELERSPLSRDKISNLQLISIAKSFHWDLEIVHQVMIDIVSALRPWHVDVDSSWINSDAAHDILLHMEVQSKRKKHQAEHSIKISWHLTEDEFWRFRPELIRLRHLMAMVLAEVHRGKSEERKLDRTGALQLLKLLGLQPYHEEQQELIEQGIDQVCGSQDEYFDFKKMLWLLDHTRDGQKSIRSDQLLKHFKVQVKTVAYTIPISEADHILFDPEVGVNMAHASIDEAEEVKKVIDETDSADPGYLTFSELADLIQRAVETLHSKRAETNFSKAIAEGVELDDFVELQRLFDSYDKDNSGVLEQDEVLEAVMHKTGRSVSQQELESLYYSRSLNIDVPLFLWDFLRVIDAPAITNKPYTLREIPIDKLREILVLFQVPHQTIGKLVGRQLAQMVGNHMGIDFKQNLRKLEPPIQNPEELVRIARVCVLERKEEQENVKLKLNTRKRHATVEVGSKWRNANPKLRFAVAMMARSSRSSSP
eukprot:TRINITY_DN28924_c0_g1_i1.p1 TRINITY_DN28924_c0_g1~~TRINITY_DN28924_c0_g1_i1.p1  ORF type:complete len:1033 (-),score=190.50 TRINITY_DN28924_c0_g1_i1:246-3344(-)